MEDILGKFTLDRDAKHPITGKPMSKTTRIENMYFILNNLVYDKKYTKEERLFALDLIKIIIQEQ